MKISEISIERRLSMNTANGLSAEKPFEHAKGSDDVEAILALTNMGYRVLVPYVSTFKDGSGVWYSWREIGDVYSEYYEDEDIIEWWELPIPAASASQPAAEENPK